MTIQKVIYDEAKQFIEKYLSHTDIRTDSLLAKDLYAEYCDSTDKVLTKRQFNKVLGLHGFLVARGNGNRLTVFHIKSSWL